MTVHILHQAVPLMAASVVQLLYNLVDRMYIGHIQGAGAAAISGLGLTLPVITLMTAFTQLYSSGASPLFAISLGKQDRKEATAYMGLCFVLLVLTSILFCIAGIVFCDPILAFLGGSTSTIPYARAYLNVVLLGTLFSMVSTGMNPFASAQGKPGLAMLTTLFGAVLNIILDPLFIFVFGWGIAGAAWATVLSQFVSAVWILFILFRLPVPLSFSGFVFDWKKVGKIFALGTTGFVMQASNFAVQMSMNQQLVKLAGDVQIGVYAILSSVRDISNLPIMALAQGSQPVLGYNFGAKQYGRVWKGIRLVTLFCLVVNVTLWAGILMFPAPVISLFTNDRELVSLAITSLYPFFGGFVFMTFQASAQSTFVALGQAKYAVFFSIFRKIILVLPLIYILPVWFGLSGVYLSEPISNVVGGICAYCTMLVVMKRLLKT